MQSPSAPSPKRRAQPASTVGASVLLADDNPAVLRAFARALTRAGFAVTTASDGAGAEEHLRRTRFDAVLCDVNMPGRTGLDVLRAARTHDLDVPVLLMSGGGSYTVASEAIEYGAFRFLTKPIAPLELEATIAQAVRLGRIARMRREAGDGATAPGSGPGDLAGLEVSFQQAVGSLWMAFQPIVSFAERKLVGYEALARTKAAALATPGHLFDAAERLGRVHHVGRAIRGLIAHRMECAPSGVSIFVNLHPLELQDDELFSLYTPLAPFAERVVFEVTERTALEAIADARIRVQKLRKIGYRVAIDDLGAGYAGLSSFVQLEPDIVKIDMSLVRGIGADPRRRAMVGALLQLCEELQTQVVAEGVETAEERDVLAELGCGLLQGYLFGKPSADFVAPMWG